MMRRGRKLFNNKPSEVSSYGGEREREREREIWGWGGGEYVIWLHTCGLEACSILTTIAVSDYPFKVSKTE